MAIRPGLNLRTSQKLALTPEIRQGMRLLAMPLPALAEELQRLADDNPLLLIDHPAELASITPSARSAYDIASETVASPTDLGSHLRAQLAVMGLAPDVVRAAQAVTWSLDDRGYLDGDLDGIAELAGTTLETAEAALVAVQACDPSGVAARNLRECLALQLAAHGLDPDDAQKAALGLDEIVSGKWTKAETVTGLAKGTLMRVGQLLPGLSAVPAASFVAAASAITPDLVLSFAEDGTAYLDAPRHLHPTLRIDDVMHGQMKTQARLSEDWKDFASAARRILAGLQFRSDTVLRVGQAIVVHQRGFLDPERADPMRPLQRQTLATELGLHPATIGRAVSGKFMATPKGTFPLSVFFPTRLGQAGHSAHAVQQRMVELVAAEQPGTILSDASIAQQLQLEGVDIARRTVAKYRGCLGIAPSHIRKRRTTARR